MLTNPSTLNDKALKAIDDILSATFYRIKKNSDLISELWFEYALEQYKRRNTPKHTFDF